MRLKDILDYGRIAIELVAAEGAIETDVRNRLALERALFIVGEAAANLSPTVRRIIHQPWSDIIGFRPVLAHRYESISAERLADIARRDLPPLLKAIEKYLAGAAKKPTSSDDVR